MLFFHLHLRSKQLQSLVYEATRGIRDIFGATLKDTKKKQQATCLSYTLRVVPGDHRVIDSHVPRSHRRLAFTSSSSSSFTFVAFANRADINTFGLAQNRFNVYILFEIPMERCPLEIWTRIFALACTDTGVTGCSLAQVSKYVRQSSRETRYQCLAVYHPKAFELLPRVLENLDLGQTPVTNLLIATPALRGSALALRDINVRESLSKEGILEHTSRIINIVAPTLRHLSLHLTYDKTNYVNLFPNAMPKLVTLAVLATPLIAAYFTRFRSQPPFTLSLPALDRLQVCQNTTSVIAIMLRGAAPALQQIHISDIVERLSPQLLSSLGMDQPDPNRQSGMFFTSPRVTRLILEAPESSKDRRLRVGVTGGDPSFQATPDVRLGRQLCTLQRQEHWVTVIQSLPPRDRTRETIASAWFDGGYAQVFDTRDVLK